MAKFNRQKRPTIKDYFRNKISRVGSMPFHPPQDRLYDGKWTLMGEN